MGRRRSRVGVLLSLAAGTVLLFAACDDGAGPVDGRDVTEGSDSGNGVDVEAILDHVDEVRLLFAEGSTTYPPDVIDDAEYGAGQLVVAVTDDIEGLEDANRFCNELSGAIAAPDLSIVVQDQHGVILTECRFDS